ncbi:MAG: Clp protease N-terminal domain-containing protein [Candidatus Nealsonbacteria bacterium]
MSDLRWSCEAEQVMEQTKLIAHDLGHREVYTFHILLSLIQHNGTAGIILKKYLNYDLFLEYFLRLKKSGKEKCLDIDLPWSLVAQNVNHYASDLAEELGHSFVSSLHLLLALVISEGIAVSYMRDLQVCPKLIENEVLQYLQINLLDSSGRIQQVRSFSGCGFKDNEEFLFIPLEDDEQFSLMGAFEKDMTCLGSTNGRKIVL